MIRGLSSLKYSDLAQNSKRVDYGDEDRELFGPSLGSMDANSRMDLALNKNTPHQTERVLSFEATYEGPYTRPLIGEYDVMSLYPVSGLCPLCNHSRHKEIDKDIASLPWRRVAKAWKVPYQQLLTHVSRHMGPIYGRIASRYMKSVPEEVAAEVLSKVQTDEIDALSYRTSVDALKYPDDLPLDPKSGEYGKLRVWSKERILNEVAIREREAIDYYDEMLVCKKDLERVYDEIMGNTFYISSKSGEMIEANKPYSAAVAAKREIHSILDSLAKFSVIAARISASPGNEGMNLSPEMDSMVSSILGKDYRQKLTNMNTSLAADIKDNMTNITDDIDMVEAEII